MDMINFMRELSWGLATLPLTYMFGTGNHMRSRVLSKVTPYVVITGCDSGVGMLTAIHMQNNGLEVIATCESDEGVERLKDRVKLAMKMDVTKDRDINQVMQRTQTMLNQDTRGRLWGLINNAGMNIAAPIDWMSFEDFRRMAEVNYLGAVHMTKMFLPMLKATPGSRVINICGFGGMDSPSSMGGYAPSKVALECFSNELAVEMKPFDVHVVVIDLPKLRTPMMENIEESARAYYNNLTPEMKRQYPREDVETYFTSLGSACRRYATDPIEGVRMIMRALRAERPQFKYCPSETMMWKLIEFMLPPETKQNMSRSYRAGILPKAISPAQPLPTAAA